jgi:hypothetical protein
MECSIVNVHWSFFPPIRASHEWWLHDSSETAVHTYQTTKHHFTKYSNNLFILVNLVIDISTVWNITGSSRQLGPCGPEGGGTQLRVAVWCHRPANGVSSGQHYLPVSPLFANFNPLQHVAVQEAWVRCPAFCVHHMCSVFSYTRLTSASVIIEFTWRKRTCWHHQIRPEN